MEKILKINTYLPLKFSKYEKNLDFSPHQKLAQRRCGKNTTFLRTVFIKRGEKTFFK